MTAMEPLAKLPAVSKDLHSGMTRNAGGKRPGSAVKILTNSLAFRPSRPLSATPAPSLAVSLLVSLSLRLRLSFPPSLRLCATPSPS